jgi:hypothetical protein
MGSNGSGGSARNQRHGDLCRRGDRSGENLRPHIGSGIGAGPLGDRRGERLLHLGVDLQVLAADRGRAHDQLDRAHQLRVKRLPGLLVVLQHRVDDGIP